MPKKRVAKKPKKQLKPVELLDENMIPVKKEN